jgi:hypothetical protein
MARSSGDCEQCPPPSRVAGEAGGLATPGGGWRGEGRARGGGARGRGQGGGLRALLLCAGLLRARGAARGGHCPPLASAAASPWPRPTRSSPLAPTLPAPQLPPPPSWAMRSAGPALAALPPGPQTAPQEGEGRGAVAVARLTGGRARLLKGPLPHRTAVLPWSLHS